ncbi:hypothetical protein AYO20_05662 [Fonsecaea nubica]|uniref:FAD/NAD(P)-binding domain-containing protein n=1 Tax=Fonsecaea nubica TaxID=856822 RepID=A0A178CZX8_9EURO|nr:hypothetical protein AYO20_05662 [Fonsecaea nubica]OAL34947.1 hypothetical protein AYO20_05662 [Fonsecaea nubica]
MSVKLTDYDAIVVGAGFGGIRTLWELVQTGLTVKCFEAGSDVGSAWYWNRYPGARTDSEAWDDVQRYLGHVTDHFDLRKKIEFNTRIASAHYSDSQKTWTITNPPFTGLKSYTGEWYQASRWPNKPIDFRGKRVAIVGTGATGVQIIPKIAPVAKELIVFQRTPNYVLPGRNYTFDEYQKAAIKQNYDITWNRASQHPFGLAMVSSGKVVKGLADADKIRQILDSGWESGGFHFQFETFDDLVTDPESNEIASEYLRQKIRAIVQDPETAEALCPKYLFLSKRPPCGHFYYETFNRPKS